MAAGDGPLNVGQVTLYPDYTSPSYNRLLSILRLASPEVTGTSPVPVTSSLRAPGIFLLTELASAGIISLVDCL